MCHTVHVYFCKQLQLAAVTISTMCDTVSCNLQEEKYHKYWRTTIKIKRRTDINQDIFIPQGWMISAQTTQLDLQQTFNGKLYLVVGQTNGIVTVPDVKVERDAPHDDEVHPLLLQLPGQCARGSRKTEKYQLKILISLQTFNSMNWCKVVRFINRS